MNEDQLTALMNAHPAKLDGQLAQPEQALRSAEAAWDKHPHDRVLAGLVHAIHGRITADQDLPLDVGTVRRGRLVKWDNWTTTWQGVDLQTGAPVLVRVLRPHLIGDAIMCRALAREGTALRGLVTGVGFNESPLPHLTAPLPGTALATDRLPHAMLLGQLLGSAATELANWQKAGVLPPLEANWRENEGSLTWVGLQCSTGHDAGPHLAALAQQLMGDMEPNSALQEFTQALVFAPPLQAKEVPAMIVRALAVDLAATRHSLKSAWHIGAHNNRERRLIDCVKRLQASLAPPKGLGAVGVDLEGNTTVVEGRDGGLWWGPIHQTTAVWTSDGTWDAHHGRRLIRARAAAPPSERLNRQVGGDISYPDRARRWVAAALSIRTILLLLERS
ncbi:MAG: hypothetical protein GWP91_25475 [Rhodobacterales bacterium]|nr:hypothetical protein [Rhodobacterales bacterium]